MNNPIQSFDFSTSSIRTLTIDDQPWFIAADVCKVLGLSNTTKALLALDDDEQALTTIQGISRGNSRANIVNESGLYALIFKSRKPVAKKFRKWVTNEVLPALRQTGQYSMQAPVPVEHLASKDMNNIRKIIGKIVRGHKEDHAWLQAIWFRLRTVTHCPAPNRFEVQHIPALTEELKRIWELSEAVQTAQEQANQLMIKRVLRGGELQGPLLDTMQRQLAASLADDAAAVQEGLSEWKLKDLDSLQRREETFFDKYIDHLNEPPSLLSHEPGTTGAEPTGKSSSS